MAFLSIFIGYYILNVYKLFGADFGGSLADDNFLTTVGILSSLSGTLRFAWTALLDYKWLSFKIVYSILLVV